MLDKSQEKEPLAVTKTSLAMLELNWVIGYPFLGFGERSGGLEESHGAED